MTGSSVDTNHATIKAAANDFSESTTFETYPRVQTFFPSTLYTLLEEAENNDELRKIISWLPDGSGFKIHHEEDFCNIVMKKYFQAQTKFRSFTRQVRGGVCFVFVVYILSNRSFVFVC